MTRLDRKMYGLEDEVVVLSGYKYSKLAHPLISQVRDGDILTVDGRDCLVITNYGQIITHNDIDLFDVIAPLVLLSDVSRFTTTNSSDYFDVGFRLEYSENNRRTWCRADE